MSTKLSDLDLCACGQNVDGEGKWKKCTNYECRLRLTDVKAEHYERKVATLESNVETWEKKYDETEAKLKAAQAEIEEMVKAMTDV